MIVMKLQGTSIIGSRRGHKTTGTFQGIDPYTGKRLAPLFYSAETDELETAANLAGDAFKSYRRTTGRERAMFLRRIADNLLASAEAITGRAVAETALPAGRIQSEINRTVQQLRMFADLVEEGSWVDARIDRADPGRKPAPKPDIRSMMQPLGPVAVFCAGNFPLAFSVAGGDTASALAAGNPVIVNAHYAHPGTAEIAGSSIREAVQAGNFHEGVFSLLYSSGYDLGLALVKHPSIKAVGFTGSRRGGHALIDAARSRPEPIPVFAEMSSTNPVFILPRALKEKGSGIAAGMFSSVTLGAGQFCTNPGLVFLPDDDIAERFTEELARMIYSPGNYTMLTPGIQDAYKKNIITRKKNSAIELLAESPVSEQGGLCEVGAALFRVDAQAFIENRALQEEIFGPSSLIVRCSGRQQILSVAYALEGHLTATVHGTEEDLREYSELLGVLETRVGRIVLNGYPTGVEVCHAMVHGGPYPATSDSRSSSVGSRAIQRFARPVCYQNFPDSCLPEELKNDNPGGIWRMVDGQWTGL